MPRRDATTRDDYHTIRAGNRHALTPTGWVHEQDNAKLILTGDKPTLLVREVGVNTYTRSSDFAVTIATDYWTKTADFWAEVRSIWTELEKGDYLALTMAGEPEALYMPLLTLAGALVEGETSLEDAKRDARDIIANFTETKPAPLAERLARTADRANSR